MGFGYFFFALTFAHLALAAALILARPAALIFRLAFLAGFTDNFSPLIFAHRAWRQQKSSLCRLHSSCVLLRNRLSHRFG